MVGIGVLSILFILVFLLARKNVDGVLQTMISAFVLLHAFLVVCAEVLSIFGWFSYGPVVIVSVVCIVGIISFGRGTLLKTVERKKREKLANIRHFLISAVFFLSVMVFAVSTVRKGLMYPPQNYDSLNFHCTRALYYWKYHRIANYSYSLTSAFYYYPPMNALLMSYGLIFLRGSDVLNNLIQFPSWVIAVYAVGGISDYLLEDIHGTKERIGSSHLYLLRYIPMSLMLFVPMSVLLVNTTQDDLLVASFSVITVYLLICLLRAKENQRLFFAVCAGASAGLSMYSKMTCLTVLGTMALYCVVLIIRKWPVRDTLVTSGIVVGCCALINIGQWIRTGVDLHGDFIGLSAAPLRSSSGDSLILKIIANIGYCMGSGNQEWSNNIDDIVRAIGYRFTSNPQRFDNYTTWGEVYSHDAYPNGFHAIVVMLAILVAVTIGLAKRSKELILYIICGVVATCGIAASMNIFVCAPRYLLPGLFMLLPLTSICISPIVTGIDNLLSDKDKQKLVVSLLLNAGLMLVMVISLRQAMRIQKADWYMPIPQYPSESTYEELRYRRVWSLQEPTTFIRSYMEQHGYSTIGIQENIVSPIYPLIYQFRDGYNLQYINDEYIQPGSTKVNLNQHKVEDFVPDCILLIETRDVEIKNTYTYEGDTYERVSDTYTVSVSTLTLYERK